ncbi:glycosyltransferase family 2 protein [Falsiroseomonas sp. HW251]|uniref:glycosyltransferase family 2 protein n=1 Tax=Falsiroseomonas sp. HW251 TaxID=3390998 RepID=UPI003D319BB5
MTPPWLEEALAEAGTVVFDVLRACAAPLPPPDSPIVLLAARNEILRIEAFLDHYRRAGIRRFCVVDNASDDGTAELLAAQPDVDLLSTARPFATFRKQGWLIAAMRRYGEGRWYLYPDADELVVFDGIETRGFDALARLLEARGIPRLRGITLDMYPGDALDRSALPDGAGLLEATPFHDAAGYAEAEGPLGMTIRGGPRQRLLAGRIGRGAQLTKMPLFRATAGALPAHPHFIWPTGGNWAAPRLLALLHLKFLPDLTARAQANVARGGYAHDGVMYRQIGAVLAARPSVRLKGRLSRRYAGSAGLVEAGLIAPVPWTGGAVLAPPPVAVSALSPAALEPRDVALLRRAIAGVEAVAVFGLGPETMLALRLGQARIVAAEPDRALAQAFARRPLAQAAAEAGRLRLTEADAARPWAHWPREDAWPGLVILAGRRRAALALATLRQAALCGVPAAGVAILFRGFDEHHPAHAALRAFADIVARGPRLALLRARDGNRPQALKAALLAQRGDARYRRSG